MLLAIEPHDARPSPPACGRDKSALDGLQASSARASRPLGAALGRSCRPASDAPAGVGGRQGERGTRSDGSRTPWIRRSLIVLLAAVLLSPASGCSGLPAEVGRLDNATPAAMAGSSEPTASDDLHVVATTTLIADVARQIAGPGVRVTSLMDPGDDPHGFRLTPDHMRTLEAADLVLANGLGLEPFLDRVESGVSGARIVRLSEGLPDLDPAGPGGRSEASDGDDGGTVTESGELQASSDHEGGRSVGGDAGDASGHPTRDRTRDPHVWFVPSYVAEWAERIAGELAQIDPESADELDDRVRAFGERMDELDRWIADRVDTIPPARRVVVTDHAVLDRFAARYGLEAVGAVIPAHTSLAQPSAGDLARLQDALTTHGAPAIFVGANTPSRVADRLSEDTGVPVVRIFTGGLSEPGGEAADYESFMRTNVRRIVDALR